MSAHAIIESERARMSFIREGGRMGFTELRGELIVGGSFICAASALALFAPFNRGFSLSIAALYVLSLSVAGHVRVDVGSGFTVPTQVVFVPMLFAIPLSIVPLLVALSLSLGMVPGVLRGGVSPNRLLTVPSNSWFALGPALVMIVGSETTPDARIGILVLALAAQFACDFAANVARERLCGGISIGDLVIEAREVYLIDCALASLGLAVALASQYRPWAVLLVAPLLVIVKLFSKERRTRLQQLIELGDAYRGTALVLGDVVEADDAYTGEHCKGVVRLALDVADRLGLGARERRNVEFGALLHDVGKIAVPKEIINKPGKLDEREWEVIKTHTIEGQKMLERVGGFMREVGEIVRSSHERWDGDGYPDRLSGSTIPLEARIVSACDAFNAMTTTRSYRTAMPLEVAVAELTKNSGTQFDPDVVTALLEVVRP